MVVPFAGLKTPDGTVIFEVVVINLSLSDAVSV